MTDNRPEMIEVKQNPAAPRIKADNAVVFFAVDDIEITLTAYTQNVLALSTNPDRSFIDATPGAVELGKVRLSSDAARHLAFNLLQGLFISGKISADDATKKFLEVRDHATAALQAWLEANTDASQ